MKILKVFCIVILGICFGCGPRNDVNPVLLTSLRPTPSDIETVEIKVSRREYQAALVNEGANRTFRLVKLFKTGPNAEALPEYRVFGSTQGGAYYLLGIRNADVLIGAHAYVIRSIIGFINYVGLLANETETTIEVRRGDKDLILKISFLPT